ELPHARVGGGGGESLACPDVPEHDLSAIRERGVYAREPALDELVLTDGPAPLLPLTRVPERDLEGALHDAVADRRQPHAFAREALPQVGSLGAAAEEAVRRDAAIGEEDLAGRARAEAHLVEGRPGVEAGIAALAEERF